MSRKCFSKEWISQCLGIRIIVVTGVVRPGLSSTIVFDPRTTHDAEATQQWIPKDAWLWQHNITDGAGHKSPHYDLITQVGSMFVKNMNMFF